MEGVNCELQLQLIKCSYELGGTIAVCSMKNTFLDEVIIEGPVPSARVRSYSEGASFPRGPFERDAARIEEWFKQEGTHNASVKRLPTDVTEAPSDGMASDVSEVSSDTENDVHDDHQNSQPWPKRVFAPWKLQKLSPGPTQECATHLRDQLMVGNCVHEAVELIRGAVPRMLLESESCLSQVRSQVVSLTINHAPPDDAEALSCELCGALKDIAMADFGHWALLEIFENKKIPMELILSFAEELCPHVVELSKHKNGTCVVQRLVGRLLELGRSFGGTVSRNVTQQILPHLIEFCRHENAHHVVKTFLKVGCRLHQHEILLRIFPQIYDIASDPCGSLVLKAAFECCSPEDQRLISAYLPEEP